MESTSDSPQELVWCAKQIRLDNGLRCALEIQKETFEGETTEVPVPFEVDQVVTFWQAPQQTNAAMDMGVAALKREKRQWSLALSKEILCGCCFSLLGFLNCVFLVPRCLAGCLVCCCAWWGRLCPQRNAEFSRALFRTGPDSYNLI